MPVGTRGDNLPARAPEPGEFVGRSVRICCRLLLRPGLPLDRLHRISSRSSASCGSVPRPFKMAHCSRSGRPPRIDGVSVLHAGGLQPSSRVARPLTSRICTSGHTRCGVTQLPIRIEHCVPHGSDDRCHFGLVGAETMTFQSVPEAIPIGIATVFSCALAFFAWRRRTMPMAPAFATMMAGETAWALARRWSRSSPSYPSSDCASISDSSARSPRFWACRPLSSATPACPAG